MTIFSTNTGSFEHVTISSGVTASNALITGVATVRELRTLIVTSSTLYESGSTKFGDSADDTHQFTGSLGVSGNVIINGTSYTAATSGTSGTAGSSGSSGTAGSSGTSGTAGSSGSTGTSGSSGTAGSSGSSGTSGTSGSSGSAGTSGSSGSTGTSGSSGSTGTSGSSGSSGTSGSAGTSGTSGSVGTSGSSGSSGSAGTSGSSGSSGTSGSSGSAGTAGSSGTSGSSGSAGTSGSSGSAGTSGSSGSAGTSGSSGSAGTSGSAGSAGTSGVNGSSGSSGTSGANGSSGTSGANGSSGTSGANGSSGTSGANGSSGSSGTSASVTINSNTNNYVVTATGTTNTLQGEANLYFDGTNLGVGTTSVANSENWATVVDVYGGGAHAKSIVTTTNIETGVWSHNSGFYGAPAGGIAGTRTNNPYSLITSGSTRMTITSTGNVGIGLTNPGDRLVVRNAVGGDGIKIQHTNGTEIIDMGGETDGDAYMYLNDGSGTSKILLYSNGSSYFNGGNVGINTTDANTKLEVQIASNNTGLAEGLIFKIKNTSTTTNSRAGISFGNIATIGSNLVMQSAILKDGTTGEFDMIWDLYGGTAGWKEGLLYLDSNPGQVGIGTTAPNSPLHVWTSTGISGGSGTSAVRIRSTNSTDRTTRIQLEDYAGAYADGIIEFVLPTAGTGTGARLSLGTDAGVLHLLKNGNVGINTTSPNATLDVKVQSGTNIFRATDSSNQYRWRVDQNFEMFLTNASGTDICEIGQDQVYFNQGSVGIGTTSPATKLEVLGNNITLNIIQDYASSGYGYSKLFLGHKASTGGDNAAIMHDSNYADLYIDNNYDSAAGTYGRIWFRQMVSSTLTTVMSIRDQKVGIGTTNPTAKLYIEGGSANWSETTPGTTVGTIHLDPGSASDNFGNAITFGASDSDNGTLAQAGIYVRTDGSYGTKMYFATCDNYSLGSKVRMMIDYNGFVGLGTTSPSKKLVVVGSGTGEMWVGDAGFGSGNYTGIGLGAALATGTYNILSSPTDPALYLNRPAGYGMYFRMNNADHMTIDSGGLVGIGTSPATYRLRVQGDIYASADVIAYSDARVKENVVTIDNALNKVSNLRGVYYTRKDIENKERNLGVIAQEVLEVVPELVSYAEQSDEYAVKYQNMTALLIEAIKELNTTVNKLEHDNTELRSRITTLEGQ